MSDIEKKIIDKENFKNEIFDLYDKFYWFGKFTLRSIDPEISNKVTNVFRNCNSVKEIVPLLKDIFIFQAHHEMKIIDKETALYMIVNLIDLYTYINKK